MKSNRIVLSLLLLLLLSGCRTALDAEDGQGPSLPGDGPSDTQGADMLDPFSVDWDDRTPFEPGLIASERGVLDSLPGASVYHLDLELSPDMKTLIGKQSLRYTNQEDTALGELYFRLFPNISGGAAAITELTISGEAVEPVYDLGGSALVAALPEPLVPGASVLVSMNFIVEIPLEMGGNYGLFGHFGDMIMIQNFYPVVPVYDDEGWNVEIPPQNGDVTYFDASFYLARLTVPADLSVITSGTTLESEEQEGQRVIVFAAGPVRDIYIAASENFVAATGTVGETRVVSYSLEEYERGSHTALEVAMSALKSFDDRFGVYPYAEFELVSTPMQALGMEYPGVVAVAINLYDPESELGGMPAEIYLESTVAHEVAHQWFFNVVGSDQIDEPWLDEAVVQYATMLYYQDVHGDSGAAGFRQSWLDRWDRVDREEIPIGMPVARYDGREYGAIVYGRGPLFLEALRETMGDVAFDDFLQSYYTTYKWDLATPAGFRALAEQACDCDLTALFEAWVYFD